MAQAESVVPERRQSNGDRYSVASVSTDSSSCNDYTNTKSTPKDSDLVGGSSLRDCRESTITCSLANFSRAEVGGVLGGGKYPPPITPPTSAREKLVWPARLNNALVRRD